MFSMLAKLQGYCLKITLNFKDRDIIKRQLYEFNKNTKYPNVKIK